MRMATLVLAVLAALLPCTLSADEWRVNCPKGADIEANLEDAGTFDGRPIKNIRIIKAECRDDMKVIQRLHPFAGIFHEYTINDENVPSVVFVSSARPNEWVARVTAGATVKGIKNNEDIGKVIAILFDGHGVARAYILGVGGFLGVGEKNIAIDPGSFQVVAGDAKTPGHLKLPVDKAEALKAPPFETKF